MFLFVIFFVFRRGDAFFFFEHLAEIGRRVKPTLDGHLGHVGATAFNQVAGFLDLDSVEIGHQ